MILPSEFMTDFGEGGVNMLATEVHGDLAWERQAPDPTLPGQVDQFDPEKICDRLLDLFDGQNPVDGGKDVFHDVLGQGDRDRDPGEGGEGVQPDERAFQLPNIGFDV